MSTDLGTGVLTFFSHQGRKFVQQSFFAWETIHRHHERKKVPRLLEAKLEEVLFFSLAFMGC
jgi:hypothetical protein